MKDMRSEALHHVIDRLDIGIIVLDRELRVLFWNRFMAANSAKTVTDVLGRRLPELFPELPERWLRKKVETVFVLKNQAFTSWEQRPYLFRFRHNRPITGGADYMFQNCTFIPCRDHAGEVESVAVTVQDVTDLAIAQRALADARDALEQSSRLDGLTGIFNRRHWEHCLALEFKRSRRNGSVLALIMFDLDHFKSINDRYGHLAGDEVLRAVGRRLAQVVRETDIVGRYGGEEFGVILPECDCDGAAVLAERIRIAMQELEIVCDGLRIPVTVSLGVAQSEATAESHEALIGHADQALYCSKRSGRNTFRIHRND